jgi:hypothetical protein
MKAKGKRLELKIDVIKFSVSSAIILLLYLNRLGNNAETLMPSALCLPPI